MHPRRHQLDTTEPALREFLVHLEREERSTLCGEAQYPLGSMKYKCTFRLGVKKHYAHYRAGHSRMSSPSSSNAPITILGKAHENDEQTEEYR